MSRPKKCRRICALPNNDSFGPLNLQQNEEISISMTLDEYETIRLIDLLGCMQEDCAEQMGVSRTTVQAVYNTARKKLADALVNGKKLVIQGGDYILCAHSGSCCGENCERRSCTNRRCEQNKLTDGGCCHENCSHV